MINELLWDFYLGITHYWLKDQSEGQNKTLQLLDQALALLNEILKSNILGRLADLLFFLPENIFCNPQ